MKGKTFTMKVKKEIKIILKQLLKSISKRKDLKQRLELEIKPLNPIGEKSNTGRVLTISRTSS